MDYGYIKLQIIGVLQVGVYCYPEIRFMFKCMGMLRIPTFKVKKQMLWFIENLKILQSVVLGDTYMGGV